MRINGAVGIVALAACAIALPAEALGADESLHSCSAHEAGSSGIGNVYDRLLKADRPLAALALAEELSEGGTLPPGVLEQLAAIAGLEATSLAKSSVPLQSEGLCPAGMDVLHAEPALTYLIRAIRESDADVVILNESHSTQLHRIFAHRLVEHLLAQGFTSVGGETFSVQIGDTLRDDAPDTLTGVYTSDPVLGDLVRFAHSRGTQLFGYDHPVNDLPVGATGVERTNARERIQAEAIAAVLAQNKARKKTILLVGSAHGSKALGQDGIRRMALRLFEDHAITSYSIDQVQGTLFGGRYAVGDICISPGAQHAVPTTSVLKRMEGSVLARLGFDVTVFHPAYSETHGRPSWIFSIPGRIPKRVALTSMPKRTIIRAFLAGEPLGSVAIDQVIIPVGHTEATLSLPDAPIRLVREDEECNQWPVHAQVLVGE